MGAAYGRETVRRAKITENFRVRKKNSAQIFLGKLFLKPLEGTALNDVTVVRLLDI